MGELIEAYRVHLASKSPSAQQAFEYVAKKLVPLSRMRVLTVTGSMWEGWFAESTRGFAESYRRQVRAYVRSMLSGTANHLARDPARPSGVKGPGLELTPEKRQGLKHPRPGPRSRQFRDPWRMERDRLIGHLVAAGFYTGEILAVRFAGDGGIELARNWGRHAAPTSLPPGLDGRLRAYAIGRGIRAGERVFTVSDQWIRHIVARAVRRATETKAPIPKLSSRLRELLRGSSSSVAALAKALDARGDSVYRALRRMKDAVPMHGTRGRGKEGVWSLRAPAPHG